MTWEQYWHGDPLMVRAFREADKLRQRREDAIAWLHGRYIYDALGRLSPILHAFSKRGAKAEPYLDRPFLDQADEPDPEDMTEEQRAVYEENQLKKERIRMLNMRIAGSNWGK